MENAPSKKMRPLLVRRGEALPDNFVPMTDSEVLDIQKKRIKNFTPQSDMRIFKYSNQVLATTAGMSGYVINTIFRKNFRLGGLKVFFTYGASVLLPSVLSYGVHEMVMKPKILLGMESCPTCLSVRTGAYQSAVGVCYPYVISLVACLATAREYYTLDIAATKQPMSFFRLLRHVSPSPSIIIALGILNMLTGMEVSRREIQTYVKHLSKPSSPNTDYENEGGQWN